MKWLKIDGKEWDVRVLDIVENFNILYSDNTGRTISRGARMVLDPLGTFYGHKITVARKKGEINEFDKLFNYISQPRYDGMNVEAVHDQTTISYDAYVSTGERKVLKIQENVDGEIKQVDYDAYEINFIAMEAQVKP